MRGQADIFRLKILKRRSCLPGLAVILVWLSYVPLVVAQTPISLSFLSDTGVRSYRLSPALLPAMRGFDIGYTRSDHHIEHLSVGPITVGALRTGDYLIELQDDNGHDAISGAVSLTDVSSLGSHHSVLRTDCTGRCKLEIEPISAAHVFLLTGFSFSRSGDAHIRQIKIEELAGQGFVAVTLADNDGLEPYTAYVSYALIPRSALNGTRVHAQSWAPVRGQSFQSRPPGVAMLNSFYFHFLNGDHHLQRIAVDLTGDRIGVRFRDQNGDALFEWSADYFILR